ncbi:hypothetical protein GYB22_08800 [bacterium]|nr:hypothetical protein [bacterium]
MNKSYEDLVAFIEDFIKNYDAKNWDQLMEYFSPFVKSISLDGREKKQAIVNRVNFIESRRVQPDHIQTIHNLSDFNIRMGSVCSTCQFTFEMTQFEQQLKKVSANGTCEFQLIKSDHWHIDSIKKSINAIVYEGNFISRFLSKSKPVLLGFP